MKNDLIALLKEQDIVRTSAVTLRNGKTATFYVDVKKAYGNPRLLNAIAKEMWKLIDKSVTCIAASGYGGIPLASALSAQYNVALTLVRDAVKDHGTKAVIDGYVPHSNDCIAIVDDVCTTGGSLRDTIQALEHTGAKVVGCCVVVKRGEAQLSAPLTHLLTPQDLF
ncbi:hypothetical protein COT72_01980 [archaeon CG10_big_fil_rev_8_21_14_0_10_43_11]|nr:MAG: hypothetical protein COT72_01980 [archaeon CG10_big_fil_rev_8_21_14_0_10_43_11]